MVTKTTLILTNILLLLALIYTANKESDLYQGLRKVDEVITQYETRATSLDQSKEWYTAMLTYFKANAFDLILTSR